ncbi:MAG TPA: hypothetical protein VNC50_04970, partial [Planctomycetia bacterium]|nr:hypothetical protein [Planctomycetia bacterium]
MNARLIALSCAAAAVGFTIYGSAGRADDPQAGRTAAEEDAQVLTRGPVHEAFAATASPDPRPGITAAKAPPAAINELPPAHKPLGAEVAWIPGYWAWDDEQNDFLWLSGIWRVVPPGRQWVPGYWIAANGKSQWTSGYWAAADAEEVEYLPEPPPTLEAGPNAEAPSADHLWTPGNWVWSSQRYAWRSGFWTTVQPNWLWSPARYVWTPRGYVFIDGFWDGTAERRGVLFAPVRFRSGATGAQNFAYSPTMAIDLGVFADYLFLRPNYGHYYFGDYYAPNYQTSGYFAWNRTRPHFGYDPFYAQRRWERRSDRNWEQSVQTQFQQRRDNPEARPPRTLIAANQLAAQSGNRTAASPPLVVSLDQLAKSKFSPVRMQAMDPEERRRLTEQVGEVRKYGEGRRRIEAGAAQAPGGKIAGATEPVRLKLPAAPIAAKAVPGAEGGSAGLPRRPEAPKPDPRIAPGTKRVAGGPDPSRYPPNVERPSVEPKRTAAPP